MKQNLIFSRRADNGILSVDGIMQRAPSVFAEDKSGRLTSRYHSLNTSDLLPVLADYGYHPVQAAQKRARKGEQRHAAHMVAFAKDADGDGGLRSEIIAYNSTTEPPVSSYSLVPIASSAPTVSLQAKASRPTFATLIEQWRALKKCCRASSLRCLR
jgi:hypothetical protein